MIIKVTKEHIKAGICAAPRKCPLSLAFKAAGFPKVFVGFHHIYDASFAATEHTKTSKVFVMAFDNGRPVKPTTLRFKKFRRE